MRTMSRTHLLPLALLLSLAAPPYGALAQTAPTPAATELPPAPLLAPVDGYLAGVALLGTAALAPLDLHVARIARRPGFQEPAALRVSSRGLDLLGVPGTVLLAGGLWVGGRKADAPATATAGVRAGEAIVLAEVLTYGLKVATGRARPRASPEDPLSFGLGRGLRSGDFRSFPSAHSSAAFATAVALAGEIRDGGGRGAGLAAGGLYSAAGLVALSRIYHDEHWLSDVVMGSAVGAYSGWKVRRYHRGREGELPDRWFLSVSLVEGRVAAVSLLPLAPR
jgi:membrane-associated phospholipid phosphatase